MNDDKTEFVLIGTKQQLEKVNFSSITVGDALIDAKSEVQGWTLILTCLSILVSFVHRPYTIYIL